jgi:hypothetical protein
MKNCNYCGRENTDEAAHCTGCGTSDFVSPNLEAANSRTENDRTIESDYLVRDRPKFIIVVGIWAIYGLGLFINILVLAVLRARPIGGIRGFAYFWFRIGCGVFCTYMLYRVIKNYRNHKTLAEIEKSTESSKETGNTWKCPSCDEELAQQFDSCWKCGNKKARSI